MGNLMSSLVNGDNLKDQTVANDMIAGSKSAATAYLSAILESSTPELRSMYTDSLNQILAGHAALTDLAVNKDWYKPYDMPEQQLSEIFNQSQQLVELPKE
ncbi:spore coat protein [Natroniella sulfidigena]|uniref:spore coat protein n=1 Tax=Natroniella sulfidigena TaxID=723921 RepID=UPI00200A1958|nr:spore coat protein [Natroniella sulfidigena]MCK8817137.1 spore coat protein [Natroniella sulfidigena]